MSDDIVCKPLDAQSVCDVIVHVVVRKERVGLEHHSGIAFIRRQIFYRFAVEEDVSAARLIEARNHSERRRFAAARRAEQSDEFTRLYRKGDIVDGDKFFSARSPVRVYF